MATKLVKLDELTALDLKTELEECELGTIETISV